MNVSKFLNGKTEAELPSIRSYLYKNYTKTVIESNDSNEFRIMFIANRFKSDFKNPMSFECNGIIFRYLRNEKIFLPLVIPTNLFNSQKLIKANINNHFVNGDYTLHKVYDGTIINLYFYQNSWRISTNKAFDATNLIFCENKTYSDILNELLNYYENFSFNNLDINKCYTLCFKYQKFHTFIENSSSNQNKVILIQSIDVNDFVKNGKININYIDDIGVTKSSSHIINKSDTITTITNTLNKELTRYKKQHTNENYEPLYGLILRGNFDKTSNYSNILLESNLLTKIRNFLYNHNFIKNLNFYDKLKSNDMVISKNYYNMVDINNLKNFLQGNDVNLYTTLFPQYKSNMNMFNEFLKFLTKYIIKNYNILYKHINMIGDVMKNTMVLNLDSVKGYDYCNVNKLNKLALLIVIELKNKKINILVNDNWDIIYDFINNSQYIDYYYSYLFKNDI